MRSANWRRNKATYIMLAVGLCAASACWAQVGLATKSGNVASAHSVSAHENRMPVRDPSSGEQIRPTDAVAHLAQVVLKDGKLTVAANNSDLAQILKYVSDLSGMTVEGLSACPHVFGVYGPGNISDVLRSLLIGSGYNFMILGGGSAGAPRELVLTPITPAGSANVPNAAGPDELEHQEQDRSDSEERGPGAVYPVPPQVAQDDGTRIQQNLDRLQHLQEERNASQ